VPVSSAIEQRIRGAFARQRLMTTIGASLTSVREGEVQIELPFSDALTQQHGFIHAGVVTTIVDTACGFAALTRMPADAAVLTTEFKINFMSPAKGERLSAVGRVVKAGRTLMVCLGEVFAEENGKSKQIALMTTTMMVVGTQTGLRD
jgi:uncharacterized protein (TIGR00369 family)